MKTDWTTLAGDLLRESRTTAGLSQRALAALAGVHQQEIARIERHRTQPSLPLLGRLLEVAGVGSVALAGEQVRTDYAVAVTEDVAGLLGDGEPTRATLSSCFRSVATIVDGAERWSGPLFRRAYSARPGTTGSRNFDALIAALVEQGCNDGGVKPPAWVDEAERFVDGEWISSGYDDLIDQARSESPPAFRRHGVLALEGEFSRG